MHTSHLSAALHSSISICKSAAASLSDFGSSVIDCFNKWHNRSHNHSIGKVQSRKVWQCEARKQYLSTYRLFYLYEDDVFTFISEESFFICLTWFHPALSGVIVSIWLGETILDYNTLYTSLFWYSSCSKIEFLWEEFNTSIANNIHAYTSIVIVTISIIAHLVLRVRHRQLREKIDEGIMVITYNVDGVTISRRNEDSSSCKKLWRHERTAVTPQASLVSFIFQLVAVLFQGTLFHFSGSSGLPPWAQFLIFAAFSQIFFFYNFIETVFSPNLQNSLIDFFSSRRYTYPTVIV